jgi:tetratricopeptide (TPR) repeat protein
LRDLIEAELIYPRRDPHRESYEFKHALVQDAAISTLLRNQRAQLHRQIAAALAALRADSVERNPELLAHHLQNAGDWGSALDQWQKAGAAAMARAASREAVTHFGNAIDCGKRQDDVSGGAERMVRLHLAMANALMQAEGFGSKRLFQTLEDMRLASVQAASAELQGEVVLNLAMFFYAPGRNHDYLTLTDEYLEKFTHVLGPAHLSGLLTTKGMAHFNRGEPVLAIDALRKAQDLIDRIDASDRNLLGGGDQGIVTARYLSRSLMAVGFIDDAIETTERFVQSIDQFERPFDVAWALQTKCELCALLGDNGALLATAAKIIEISERHGYRTWRGNGLIWRGIALAQSGDLDAGIIDASEGVGIWRSQGIVFNTPSLTYPLCSILVQAGRLDEASQLLDDLDTLVADTDEASHLAECIRIRGQIAACNGDLRGAERLFEKAIGVSLQQEARLFELRATTGLASVLARQGRGEEGGTRLRAVIDGFETKHSIVDLVAARNMLDSLRR